MMNTEKTTHPATVTISQNCSEGCIPAHSESMRHAMGAFPSGVTVLSTVGENGPVGMTISACASVSLDPPLILECVSRTASALPSFVTEAPVVVNVLGNDQELLARNFASRNTDRFANVSFQPDENGSPVIEGVSAWVSGRIATIHEAGDHVILIIQAESVGRNDTPPLLYHSGQMHDWSSAAIRVPVNNSNRTLHDG